MSYNTTNIHTIPNQLVSDIEKVKDNHAWAVSTARAFISMANFSDETYDEMDKLLAATEGTLLPDDYKHILNPFNTDEKGYQKFPAKLRSMPLIQPVIQLYLGDVLNRFRIENVIAVNSDVDNELKRTINVEIEKFYHQKFINALNNLGVDTGVQSKEIDIQGILDNIIDTFDDKLSIEGQDILDFLYSSLEISDKIQEYAYYFFTIGHTCTFKENRHNDVHYEVIDPRDAWFFNKNVEYGEDSDAVVVKKRFTKTQLLSKFYNEIGDDQEIINKINKLDNADALRTFNAIVFNNGSSIISKTRDEDDANYIIAYHVCWKAMRKEGELIYIDKLTNTVASTAVDETYKLDKTAGDIRIDWYWAEQAYEIYIIGNDLHFKAGYCDVQRNLLNDKSYCKLPYNQRRVYTKTQNLNSIAKIGYPFQTLYNVLHYQFEMVINKNKDKILMMPLSLIPKGPGWSIDKFMYMATSMSFGFFDDKADNAAAVVSAMKSIDMSLGQYMKEMYDLMQMVKAEFWDAVGMNRQRFGEINSSDGKATTEQALHRSALISAELFRQLEKFKEKEANGLIDVAKVAFINGKKATFNTSDGYKKTIEITGENIAQNEYAIFAVNTDKEIAKGDLLKSLALPIIQNQGNMTTVIDIIDTESFAKIKKLVKKNEKITKAYQAELEKAKQEAEMAANEANLKIANDKLEMEKYKADRLYDMTIDAAYIKLGAESPNEDSETAMSEEELALRREEIKIKQDANKVKLTDIASKERMNTLNNVIKDKNNAENNANKLAVAKKKTTTK